MSHLHATEGGAVGAAQLTDRQLEVALLLRNGLRQAEIAELLSISRRQVARLSAQARERARATTSSHLVALIASQPRQPGAAEARTR